jgi:uncharacterized protein (TIGR01777 family)
MRVLVTGATGLIGSGVCDALLARGDEVVALSRDPEKARGTNPTVTWHAWNASDERPPPAAFEGVDGVVNLVGEQINQRWNEEVKRKIRDSRGRATKNLVDAIAAAEPRPRVLVSGSAVGIYGDRGDALLDESKPPAEGFLVDVVREWEAAALEAEKSGLRVALIRTGLVLDPDGGLVKQLMVPFKMGVGGPLGSGKQYMPWIHRDDEIGLLLFALDTEAASGVLNAAAPNPVSNKDFSKAFGKALHRPAFFPAPKFAVAALRGSEMAEHTVESQRVVPQRALDLGYVFRFPEIGPAMENLVGR